MPGLIEIAGGPMGTGSPPASPSAPPTPTVISTAVGSRFVSVPQCSIAFSDSLLGPWTEQPNCYLDRLRICAAPEIDQATATWFYGSVLQPGATEFATVTPLSVAGQRVRVTITNNWDAGTNNLGSWDADANSPTLSDGSGTEGDFYTVDTAGSTSLDGTDDWEVGDVLVFRNGIWSRLTHVVWHGIVATETLHPDGNANNISSGRQTLTCYGLLYDAERMQITSSVVETIDGAAAGEFVTINRGLSFNMDSRGELAEHGNRSADMLDEGGTEYAYCFSYRERGKDEWSATQAVEYLLHHQNPWPVDAVLNDDSGNLDWLPKGGVDTDRRTVKAVLDELIQRQRGVGYYVTFDPKTEQISLNVFSFCDVDVAMPNGTTLNANPSQYSLDFESAYDVSSSELNNTITTKYHKVVVEGDWRTVTCTLSMNPSASQLDKDWTAAEQQAYFDGASRESWYAALPLKDKTDENEKARRADKLSHVFSRFKVADDWDLLSFDPEQTTTTARVFESLDTWNANGLFEDEDCESWISGLQILDHLPLRERFDYSADHITDRDWKDTVTDLDDPPPFLQPFSFYLTNVPRFPTWELLDEIDGVAQNAPDKRKWKVHTKAHHDRAAVMLNVTGGQQHFFADSDWGQIGTINQGNWDANGNSPPLASGVGTEGHYYTSTSANIALDLDGVNNWKTGDRVFFFDGTWRRAPAATGANETPLKNHPLNYSQAWTTLTFEMTEKAKIERRISMPLEGEQERTLIIPVKDCRLDYVVENTVVGITNGVLQKTTGGFVRDDRERLDTFAKAAAQWYGKKRQTIDISYKQVREIVGLGWLIVDIGSTYQNTAVNSVVTSVTYDLVNKTTSFQTDFAELDLA